MSEVLHLPTAEQPVSLFSIQVPTDNPVVKCIEQRIKFAQMRLEIDMACQFFCLSKRHAGQRFRRWVEKQQKAAK